MSTSFKVGRIDFINTAPIYYGMDTGQVSCPGETVNASPAALNKMLKTHKIRISAISSVAYAHAYPQWLILPSLSISARGPVQSVLLCMKHPLKEAGPEPVIGLSDKSATSKALTRLLLEDRSALKPRYTDIDLSAGIPPDLDGLLVIGDDALMLGYRKAYPRIIDLGAFWADWTGLPFVFGLWAVDKGFAESNPKETGAVVQALHNSKELGKKNSDAAAMLASQRTGVPKKTCRAYLANIECDLGKEHRAGLDRFYDLLKARGEIEKAVKPLFWEPARKEAGFEE